MNKDKVQTDQVSLCVCVCVSLACQHGLPDYVCVCVEKTPSVRWGFAPSRAATCAITAVVIARFDSLLVYWYFFFFTSSSRLSTGMSWRTGTSCFYQLVSFPVPFLHARFRYVIVFAKFFFLQSVMTGTLPGNVWATCKPLGINQILFSKG